MKVGRAEEMQGLQGVCGRGIMCVMLRDSVREREQERERESALSTATYFKQVGKAEQGACNCRIPCSELCELNKRKSEKCAQGRVKKLCKG